MERREDEAPFPREPWQRLLGESADGPPETTDARIRAAARRDLAPRGHRWWLPASLAASFVLAVMIVRSEFGTLQRPIRVESAAAGDSAIDARLIERGAGAEAREAGRSPAAAAPLAKRTREPAEPDAYGYLDADTGTEDAGVGPRVGGPEHELRAASELPGEAASLEDIQITSARAPQSPDAKAQQELEARAQRPLSAVAASQDRVRAAAEAAAAAAADESAAAEAAAAAAAPATSEPPPPLTPEAWYTLVKKLREQGRTAEAERELEALRKAYPDWAAKNVKAADLR